MRFIDDNEEWFHFGDFEMHDSTSSRDRACRYVTSLVQRRGRAPFLMVLFLFLASLTGILASTLQHASGVDSMTVRFPVAVGMAYLAFLLSLSLFAGHHRRKRKQVVAGDFDYCHIDVSGVPCPVPSSTGKSAAVASGNTTGRTFELGGIDGDGIAVIVLILVALGSAVLACLFMVYNAPAILAEVLVDGVLCFGEGRQFSDASSRHWLFGVVRRTFVPLISVAACYAFVGLTLESLAPRATTMFEAYRMRQSVHDQSRSRSSFPHVPHRKQ